MRIITDIETISRDQWQRLMLSSVATWFQSSKAYDFYASLPEMMSPFVVAVERDTNALAGLIVGYITLDTNPIRQFFSRRAIIIGGPLLYDDCTDEEVTALLKTLRHLIHTKAIYIEMRNFSDYSRYKAVFERCGFPYRPHYDIHIDCSDKEQMWQLIHDSKQRAIRKSKSEGWTAVEASSDGEVDAFYQLLSHLYRHKVHRPLFPVEFFRRGWKGGYAKLLVIKDKNETITGGVFGPADNGCLYEWYIVGSIAPTIAAMEFAHDLGCKRFDLMGAGEPGVPYGVRDFKMQFGGELKELGRFECINNRLLYAFGKVGVKLVALRR